jgi:hypothetical protein
MRTGVVALLAASVLLPLAPAAQAGPRYKSRYYSPQQRHSHHHHDNNWGWAVGGFAVGTIFGAVISQPRRVYVRQPAPVYVSQPPPTTTWVGPAPVPGVVQPTSPAPTITMPSAGQVWIPAATIWRESQVVEPAVYGTRRVPVIEEVEVPIFQNRSVPVTKEVVEPVFEQRTDPATGVVTKVQVGENRRTVVVGSRVENVQVGTRTESRQTGMRDEKVLVRPETTRIVRVPEHVPGHWAPFGQPETGEPVEPADGVEPMPEPTPEETPEEWARPTPGPMPPAPPPPTEEPATPEPEPVLPGPINPR